MLNRKKVGNVTEKGLVIIRRDYWAKTLKPAVQEIVQMKKKNGQRVRSEGTGFSLKAGDQSQ
jgi:hypothetical protein